jgi:predicted permease
MQAVHDQRAFPWVDALIGDVRYGWRQILRYRTGSAAAILSLGIAIGAAMAAFQLVDAVLLRSLPVADPARLFMAALGGSNANGDERYRDDFDYPEFREYSEASRDVADVLLVGMSGRTQVIFEGATEPERLYRQFVSGNVFPILGLLPATGRLLGVADDVTPGAHPVAVLSYDFWTRRFANDPAVVGRRFRNGASTFQIVGVAPKGFTGTEPGTLTDLFVPSTMNVQALNSSGWSWFRIWVRPKAGVTPEAVRQALQARLTARNAEHARTLPADAAGASRDALLSERLNLIPAGGGTSGLQRTFRGPLFVLAALVTLVLLIACGNVANILATRTLARSRELALRVSIGAGRARLAQMLLVESLVLASLAGAVGLVFAAWSAPFVVSLLAVPEDPVRVVLGADLRTAVFGLALIVSVTCALGLAPVLRASAMRPASALKGTGEAGSHRRLTRSLVTMQVAFSVFVLFVAVLFSTTFARLLCGF